MGQLIEDERLIEIDLKRNTPPARTFIHEMIHFLNPGFSEERTRELESRIWEKINNKQIERIYRKMFKS